MPCSVQYTIVWPDFLCDDVAVGLEERSGVFPDCLLLLLWQTFPNGFSHGEMMWWPSTVLKALPFPCPFNLGTTVVREKWSDIYFTCFESWAFLIWHSFSTVLANKTAVPKECQMPYPVGHAGFSMSPVGCVSWCDKLR